MRQLLNKIFPFVVILFTTFFVYFNFWYGQFPYTHDGENHLARFANYKVAIREGQFPPRWAPNLYNGYGYPVFNYNYPLANIISLPFSILKIHYETTFKVIVLSSIILGASFTYLLMKQFNFSNYASLSSSLVFISSPYLLSTVYYRGNIGEIMALGIFPAVLFFYQKPSKFIIFYSLFLLSHNIAAFLGSIFLVFYCLTMIKNSNKEFLKKSLEVSKYFLISFLLVSFFWIPAYFEKNLVVLDKAENNNEYIKHFVYIKQLFISPNTFGFSYQGDVDTLSFSLGLITVLATIISLIIIVRKKDYNYINSFFFLSLSASIYFQLNASKFVWDNLGLLQFTQFPWRFGIFATIFSLYFIAYFYESLNKNLQKILFLVIVLSIYYASKILPVDSFHKEAIYYDSYPQSTSTLNENLPKDFVHRDIGDWLPTAKITDLNGTVDTESGLQIISWNGSKREYILNLKKESLIIEPTAYFAGWSTTANSKEIQYLDNKELIKGRIAYQLPAGEYLIKTQFSQTTPIRIFANALSVLGIMIFLYFTFVKKNYGLKNE